MPGKNQNPLRSKRHAPTDEFDEDSEDFGRTFAHGDTAWETPSKVRSQIARGSALEEHEGWIAEIDGESFWFPSRPEAELEAKRYGGRVYPGLKKNGSGPTHVRYIGDASVLIEYLGRGEYNAEISLAPAGVTQFEDVIWEASVRVDASEVSDDPEFIDRLAASAVNLAIRKGPVDVSKRVRRATESAGDEGGYEVVRVNPAGLTAKGERMYEHVKAGYAGSPRAKEIAARTVLARAKEGSRGLKANPDGRYGRKIAVYKGEAGSASVYRKEGGEFFVRLDGSPPSHGYYTDDRDDAMMTAKYMASEI